MPYDLSALDHPVLDLDGDLNAQPRYLAVHEAGHALVAEAIGRQVHCMTINDCRGNASVTLVDMQANPSQCPIHFGGYLAIEKAMGCTEQPIYMMDAKMCGCEIDVAGAENCAGNYCFKLLGKVGSCPEYENILKREFCIGCQTFAWGLVVYYWDRVLKLAEALETEITMDGNRCREIFGPFTQSSKLFQ